MTMYTPTPHCRGCGRDSLTLLQEMCSRCVQEREESAKIARATSSDDEKTVLGIIDAAGGAGALRCHMSDPFGDDWERADRAVARLKSRRLIMHKQGRWFRREGR